MKIAVSSTGNSLSSAVAPFCGCHSRFAIYDTDTYVVRYVSNLADQKDLHRGSEPCGKLMVDAGIDVLVAAMIDSQPAHMLARCGIRLYRCVSATVWDAIQGLKLNLLDAIDADSGQPLLSSSMDD